MSSKDTDRIAALALATFDTALLKPQDGVVPTQIEGRDSPSAIAPPVPAAPTKL